MQEEQEREIDAEEEPAKKKKVNIPREWREVERWNLCDHSEEDIDAFIRRQLDDLNRSAGILYAVPGAHKNRNNKYGDFQFKHKWATKFRQGGSLSVRLGTASQRSRFAYQENRSQIQEICRSACAKSAVTTCLCHSRRRHDRQLSGQPGKIS